MERHESNERREADLDFFTFLVVCTKYNTRCIELISKGNPKVDGRNEIPRSFGPSGLDPRHTTNLAAGKAATANSVADSASHRSISNNHPRVRTALKLGVTASWYVRKMFRMPHDALLRVQRNMHICLYLPAETSTLCISVLVLTSFSCNSRLKELNTVQEHNNSRHYTKTTTLIQNHQHIPTTL